jgi:hypothetical protein
MSIHAEIEKIGENAQRIGHLIYRSIDLDFKIDGPASFTHIDAEHPAGSEILLKQNSQNTLQEMSYNMVKGFVSVLGKLFLIIRSTINLKIM